MKTYTFPYFVSFGPGDSADNSVDVELTDEESKRIEQSANQDCRFHLYEDASLGDIYEKVCNMAVEQEVECLRDNPSYMQEQVGEYLELDEEEAEEHEFTDDELTDYLTDYLTITVNYPFDLQG